MSGKYYWFRVKEDFFANDSLLWLEDQEGGYEAFNLYMKLCCMSLKNNGRICQQFGDKVTNHTEKSLSKVTMMDVNIVKRSLELLMEVNLLTKDEDGIYFIPLLVNMIGQEGSKAAVMRGRRNRTVTELEQDGNKMVTEVEQDGNKTVTEMEHITQSTKANLLPNCYAEIEIRDRDRDITNTTSSNHDNVFSIWNKEGFPPIREILKDEILDLIEQYGEPKVIYAIREAAKHDVRTFSYVRGVCVGGKKKKSGVPFPDVE